MVAHLVRKMSAVSPLFPTHQTLTWMSGAARVAWQTQRGDRGFGKEIFFSAAKNSGFLLKVDVFCEVLPFLDENFVLFKVYLIVCAVPSYHLFFGWTFGCHGVFFEFI